ncbi:MAG: hypothetical protein WCX06_00505 [Candidatus Paceibacterota bacterium]
MGYRLRKRIIFRADANKDVASFFRFVSDAEYNSGRSLKWAVLDKYQTCKKWFQGVRFVGCRTDVIRFVKNKYEDLAQSIASNLAHYERKWRDIEPKFDELVRQIFGDYPWPKGKYIAYSTIWGIYPRFLDDKTFQVPYRHRNKRYVNVVIAHELLHFIFYEYFFEHYPRYRGDDYDMFSWHVSEIFNNVVQNSQPWLSVFGLPSMCAPEHKKIVEKLSRFHTGDPFWNLDGLVRDIIASVEKEV